ncbi:MAG: DivIVA domain-containing protein [Ferrimicrobium sp.]
MDQVGVDSKAIREVEFRERMRGYHQDDVDQFLERVALGVEVLEAHVRSLEEELTLLRSHPTSAPASVPEVIAIGDDVIQRTLLLAQRTADQLEREAREHAGEVLEEARLEAQRTTDKAAETVRLIEEEQRARFAEESDRMSAEIDSYRSQLESLSVDMREARRRVRAELTGLLALVEQVEPRSPAPSAVLNLDTDPADHYMDADSHDGPTHFGASDDQDATIVLEGGLNESSDASRIDVHPYEEGTLSYSEEVSFAADPDDDDDAFVRFSLSGEDEPTESPVGAVDPSGDAASPQFVFGQDLATPNGDEDEPFLLWRSDND